MFSIVIKKSVYQEKKNKDTFFDRILKTIIVICISMAVNPSAPCCYNLEEGSMTTRKSITIKNDNNNKTTIFTNIIQPIIVELVKRNNIIIKYLFVIFR